MDLDEGMQRETIHILTEYSQKALWEEKMRTLWKTCFDDPAHYEDFYFDKVYTRNKIYAIEDKGMIHLNAYSCKVMHHQMVLPYIVGVATHERYRRQGVMRNLMEQVLFDLHAQRVPFTYLMPAREEYYTPFGFRSISHKVEWERDAYLAWKGPNGLLEAGDRARTQTIRYVSYKELRRMSKQFQTQLFEVISQWLEQRYDVFAVHDEMYYELLYEEKSCQSGDVVFCFQKEYRAECLCGVFAYAMDGDIPYVEQMLVRDEYANTFLRWFDQYFGKDKKIRVAASYPYMIRVVHRQAFLELFGDKLSQVCDKPVEELSDTQLVEILLEEKDNIYFAEIV